MEDRTKRALTAMRKILRTTELNGRAVMRATGLTPSQLVFMQLLEEANEQTAGYVAGRMGITQATTTALIQKLESHGMIKRRKGDQDRRQSWLSLTEAGRSLLAASPDGVQARFQNEFNKLVDWEQAMLTASLERVAAMMGNHDQDVAAVLDGKPLIELD
ncbi:MarR family transcriptional regulator (plasmid) [Aminobacter sp. Y103A]|nr:MarR family transcriptional regulator [Aminobacter niigataensis]WMD00314.1 MarR family transcriptional regulator [Aminobacter niigataensis]BBD40752.1 MarR family transcriptional regulator [Aminobacter sp. SS-2016]